MASNKTKKTETKPVEFPGTLYAIRVTYEESDYFLVSEEAGSADTEQSDTGNVGVYKLERVGKLVTTIS